MRLAREQGQGFIYLAALTQEQHFFGSIQILFQAALNIQYALLGIARNAEVTNFFNFPVKRISHFIKFCFDRRSLLRVIFNDVTEFHYSVFCSVSIDFASKLRHWHIAMRQDRGDVVEFRHLPKHISG